MSTKSISFLYRYWKMTTNGFPSLDICNMYCQYVPPQNLFYNCTGPGSPQPYTCVLSPSPSPYPSSDPTAKSRCEAVCIPPNTYFECVMWQDTPVSTGACQIATTRSPTSFTCPPGVTECNATSCPSNPCTQRQVLDVSKQSMCSSGLWTMSTIWRIFSMLGYCSWK